MGKRQTSSIRRATTRIPSEHTIVPSPNSVLYVALLDDHGNLGLKHDPKFTLALNNLDKFPIELKNASLEDLLRVPGIGPRHAQKIFNSKDKIKSYKQLQSLGVCVRKAAPFISINGKKQTLLSTFA